MARARARAFALAFGSRDVIYGTFLVGTQLLPVAMGQGASESALLPRLATLTFVVFLAYGILKTRLLGIELQVRWTIKQSTLAAVFIGVFFVAAQLAQNYLSNEFGWALGGVVAGMLLFAIAPLQRFAERVAATAMPGVQPSGEYLTYRRLQLYRAALEGAYEDGTITPKERAMLARLRSELGVQPKDADALEREVATAAPRAGAV